MNSSSNVLILSVNIDDNRASVGIKTNAVTSESNFSSNLSGNLFEVDLGAVDADFSEEDNL